MQRLLLVMVANARESSEECTIELKKRKERPVDFHGSLFKNDVLKGVFGAQSEYDW